MSRIIAAVSVALFALVGTAAVGSRYDSLESPSNQTEALIALVGTGLDLTQWLPLILIVGLLIATAGVLAR